MTIRRVKHNELARKQCYMVSVFVWDRNLHANKFVCLAQWVGELFTIACVPSGKIGVQFSEQASPTKLSIVSSLTGASFGQELQLLYGHREWHISCLTVSNKNSLNISRNCNFYITSSKLSICVKRQLIREKANHETILIQSTITNFTNFDFQQNINDYTVARSTGWW